MELGKLYRTALRVINPQVPVVDANRFSHPGDTKIGVTEVKERYRTYLMTHYLGLHITIVSVALAVAGVAAATLIGRHTGSHLELATLWILWLGSVAAMAAAYGGPMVGVFALPSYIPAISDLVLPLLIGIVEVLLFTVLVTGHGFANILDTWFILTAVFAVLAGFGVLRGGSHYRRGIKNEIYTKDLSEIISLYMQFLRRDVIGLAGTATIVVVGAVLIHVVEQPILLLPSLVTAMLLLGLLGHQQTVRMWRLLLSEDSRPEELASEQTLELADGTVSSPSLQSPVAQPDKGPSEAG